MTELNSQHLWTLKAFYFLYYAGLGCIVPYFYFIGRNLGLFHLEIINLYGGATLLGFFARPISGAIADKLKIHKLILVIGLVLQLAAIGFLFLQPIDVPRSHIPAELQCHEGSPKLKIEALFPPGLVCTNETDPVIAECADTSRHSESSGETHGSMKVYRIYQGGEPTMVSGSILTLIPVRTELESPTLCPPKYSEKFPSNCTAFLCKNLETETMRLKHSRGSGTYGAYTIPSVRNTQQYWFSMLILFLFFAGGSAAQTMADTLAVGLVNQLGRQAFFGVQTGVGAVGWLISMAVVGVVLGGFSDWRSSPPEFSIPVYTFCGLLAAAIPLALALQPRRGDTATLKWETLKTVFAKGEFWVFCIGHYFLGMLSGAAEIYILTYFKDELAATDQQIVFTLALRAMSSALFHFLSWLPLTRLGCHWITVMCFVSFGARFAAYWKLAPMHIWSMIGLEVVFHGMGSALVHVNMVTFAYKIAPCGAVGTMQGLIGLFFDVAGKGIGCLAAGSMTWQSSGFDALWELAAGAGAFAVIFGFLAVSLKKRGVLRIGDEDRQAELSTRPAETAEMQRLTKNS